MKNVVVVGAQWGDEGKGKVVDILAPHFDIVARYQGGHNAGHTVRIGDRKFILRLIPSGILHDECSCVIGNGVVVDPRAFNAELQELREMGVECEGRLVVSSRAHLILPYHVALDRAREERLGVNSVGTTMRGIGPAYEDKASRNGIRAGDLLYPDLLREKIRSNIKEKNLELVSMGAEPVAPDSTLDEFLVEALRLKPFIRDTSKMIDTATRDGKSVLIEGAQGTMLDVDHGTYPFVTSSNATAGGACTGLGIPPTRITGTVGVTKAYTTRVGSGPFPTEMPDLEASQVRDRGREYGAVTGRPRRCGWLDLALLRYAVMINGIGSLVVTKLDVFDTPREIQVCVGYRYKGTPIREMPAAVEQFGAVTPDYRTLPGWCSSTYGIRDAGALPQAARDYVKYISDGLGVEIGMISTGPERDATIVTPGSKLEAWL